MVKKLKWSLSNASATKRNSIPFRLFLNSWNWIAFAAWIFCLSSPTLSQAQKPSDYKKLISREASYKSLELASQHPDSVFVLRLKGKKLKTLPKEIKEFKNLEVLDLKNNKLDSLPAWIGDFEKLEVLILNRNYFQKLPEGVCNLSSLKVLQASENQLNEIPLCINQITDLEFLDIWGNVLVGLPDEVADLKHLKLVDMRITSLEGDTQGYLKEIMPWVKFEFSAPCNCGSD